MTKIVRNKNYIFKIEKQKLIYNFYFLADQNLSLGELKTMLSNRSLLNKFEKIVKFSHVEYAAAMSSTSPNITTTITPIKTTTAPTTTTTATTTTKTAPTKSIPDVLRVLQAKRNDNLRSVKKKKLKEEFKRKEMEMIKNKNEGSFRISGSTTEGEYKITK